MATRLEDDMFKLKVYIEPNHDFDYKLPNELVCTDYGTYEVLSESAENLLDFSIETMLYMPWHFKTNKESVKEGVIKKWNTMTINLIWIKSFSGDNEDTEDLISCFNKISEWENVDKYGNQSGYMNISKVEPQIELNVI